MKKSLLFLILISLFSINKSIEDEENTCFGHFGTSVAECNSRKIPKQYYRCCFAESTTKRDGETLDVKICINVTKHDYDNFDDFMKNAKKQSEDSGFEVLKYSVDCGSNYIIVSLLILTLILL